MANGQTPTSNDRSPSHTHMPTYSNSMNGAEPRIPGTDKVPPSQSNSAFDASNTSTNSSVTSGHSETPSKTWDFGDGADSASNVNAATTDGASSVGAHESNRGSINRSQTPTQSQPQSRRSTQQGEQEGQKTALGASKASTGKEGDRAEHPVEDESGAAKGEADSSGGDGAAPEPEGGYPEQLHAGKLEGLGPEYANKNRVVSILIDYVAWPNLPLDNNGSGDRAEGTGERSCKAWSGVKADW